ncbi:GNAT family N-acetyltransferase [Niallia sp. FSL W8-0635]|uniref:GNAT family N-acetyltransferase n=1 Tax=Niallia sp. FSL W8-0635 TaxID=2975337 RepID=UPI0009CB7130|nr:phosphinothricin N-acetyl transferase [Mycobacteroides abscessus subsp. abscessus]HEO8419392.1 N-acetyltransferase [Yersinia enterocolitica]
MIREMKETDLGEVLEIYNDAILHTTAVYDYRAHSLEDRKVWFNQKTEGGYPLFVFEEDGKVLGFATYGPFRAWPAYKYSIEHSVYVHKEARKKGIGTKLLKVLIERAEEESYATLIAGIDSTNQGSIFIHEKLGFTYSGTIKKAGYKFEKWLDLAFYQLELKGPESPKEG